MTEEFDEKPSKSQRKREMTAFKAIAERLVGLSTAQLSSLDLPEIVESAEQAKRISKGNARKRQVQHLTKLLSRTDISAVHALLDRLDASTAAHVQTFHRLEDWRERLVAGDPEAMQEITAAFPAVDRPQLRQLVRAAVKEQESGDDRTAFRKLFQFLKSLSPEN